MAIEFTQRSKINGYPQRPAVTNVRSLALKAWEASSAFRARREQAAGSARQFVPALVAIFVVFSLAAMFSCYSLTLNGQFAIKMEAKMRMKVRARSIRVCGVPPNVFASHAQFAVSQVAQKAKHWQPTDCDSDRNTMAIEFTQRSKINGYPQRPAGS